MARFRLTAAVSTVLVVTVGSAPVASARTASETTARSAAVRASAGTTVRLVTGDRVTVTSLPGGRRTATVQPGPGRDHIPIRTLEEDGSLTVMPFDAEPLVAAGTLDRRLFNVSALIAQGFDEAHSSALPLIVSSQPEPARDGARVGAQAAKATATTADRLVALHAAATPTRDLQSIHARSLRVAAGELGTFWKTLNPGGQPDAARAAVTPRVSLDGRVKAVLDRSTAQINAPAAWKAGYEGQGVKVAVLDTGVDATHPDLAGRIAEAQDFSGSGNTVDHFGHGTHVASIVGGTGAASGGSRRGVAPKADLLIGKVLGDDGSGSESQVIDGMEWAAGEHAKVVNMSLGADIETDGTDTMSQAVNALTASTGTLFVIAAGNAGPGPSTVGSPGAADSALTVGAVDRDDSLADFSSRGPRFGDKAVKPDVTAPGVGIVAARAAGTTMGDPIDANYVAASGTSMATPHVAGAAALLAQQHPDWDAQALKDALISTAHTVSGTQVTEQGGGRIDLATAMGTVTATGTVTLPPLQVGGTQRAAQAATVRYTNTGDKPVELKLAVKLATSTGRALADGAVTLGAGTVTVAPGATADVPLSTDAANVTRGDYYGYVTATTADGTEVAHTTVSLIVHAPQHRLTVVVRDRSGKVMPGWLPNIWGTDGFVQYTDRDTATAVVEEGTYYLNSGFYDAAEDGGHEAGDVVAPEVKVTKDTTVTLDASKVTEVKIRTPRPAEQHGILSTMFYRQIDGHGLMQGAMYFDEVKRLYVSPTAPVTDGTFEYSSRWQMIAPQLRAKASGASAEFTPYYYPYSPAFRDGGTRLAAVDAGDSTAPRFGAARGKLAVVRLEYPVDDRALAQAAADAGVKALLTVQPEGFDAWTRWQPNGDRWALPIMRTSWKNGSAVLARIKKGSATVEFSGTVRSPYLYDVMQVSKGSIPKQVVHTVSERNTAEVRSTYTRTGDSEWASEQRFGWRPFMDTAWNQYSRYVPVGGDRVEYVSSGDTLWQHVVHHNVVDNPDFPMQAGMHDLPHTYRPGQHAAERWFAAVVRPSIPTGGNLPSVRNGDTLSVYVPEFNDAGAGHWSFAEASAFGGGPGAGVRMPAVNDTAVAALYRDGELVAQSDEGAWGAFEVPAGDAGYRLDLTTTRTSDDWHFGTGTRTSWTFRSGTTASPAALPLLQVDYSVPVDAMNAVGADRRYALGLNVRMQDGMAAPRGVTLQVETSYDDGATWTRADTARKGDGFTAVVQRPSQVHGDAYVTLRVTATDAAGNSVRQTVDRAYLHRGAKAAGGR